VTTWTLTYASRPWTVNSEHQAGTGRRHLGHIQVRRKLVAEWRDAFAKLALAQQIPPLGRIVVTVQQHCRDRRMPDPGACYPAVKAALDGLVDAGVIPNDTGAEVLSIEMLAPVVTKGVDALELIIAPAEISVPIVGTDRMAS
jgi:crossover junction endodeoxyribonuclease RusA